MNCSCEQATRAEREAIADYLDHRGQRWIADRIRNGEHHRPHAVVAESAPPCPRNGGNARMVPGGRSLECPTCLPMPSVP